MKNLSIIIFFIVILVILSAIAQYNLKKCKGDFLTINFVTGIIINIIMVFLITILFTYGDIGKINVWWSILSITAAFIVGYTFFNEKISWSQIIGIIIIFIIIFYISQ